MWSPWRLRSPTTRLFVQKLVQASNKKTCFYLLALCEGNPPVYSRHKGPVMSWRYHMVGMAHSLQVGWTSVGAAWWLPGGSAVHSSCAGSGTRAPLVAPTAPGCVHRQAAWHHGTTARAARRASHFGPPHPARTTYHTAQDVALCDPVSGNTCSLLELNYSRQTCEWYHDASSK